MFIQTEQTPNPTTLKFIPGEPVLGPGQSLDLRDPDAAAHSPLAQKLFQIENVAGVYLGNDFISVTKADGEWQHLKPAILGVIMDHYVSGAPILAGDAETPPASSAPAAETRTYTEEEQKIVDTIIELIDTRVRPAVAQDGGDIVFHGYEAGIVYLHMQGACAGCPSSALTLKKGIENLLRHYIPEVEEVLPINP